MAAFDAMPQEWRAFCAGYGRTARGESLARLLAQSGNDIEHAKWALSVLLPLDEPPPKLRKRRLKPWATYDLKAEKRAAKPKRKRK